LDVLIVHAHPEPRSFCAALARTALETLSGVGHRVEISDLYAMKFDPVAKAADFGQRRDAGYLNYALEQRHNTELGTLAPDIEAELQKLLCCELLVLVFPLFWFSTPAILKGWIDRVLVSGATYGGRRLYDRGGLVGRKALLGITLGGREAMFGPGALHGPIEDMLRHLLQGTLAYVGLEVLPPFYAWHTPYVGEEVRAGYLLAWRRHLLALDRLQPLSFPKLGDFDDQLAPRRG
jgi:NAD(P)H dehydrogenase (quinone)